MHVAILALLIGIIAGLRAMTAPAATSWAAKLGWLALPGTHLAWFGSAITAWIFTGLALFELINDQNPKTPSRTVPPQFITRVVMGGFCGVAICLGVGSPFYGKGCPIGSVVFSILLGSIGAVIGTLGGAWARSKLAAAFGKDLYAGLLEDAIALIGAYLIVSHI